MAMAVAEREVKPWLEVALKQENLEKFSVQIAGNTEKGEGYMGEVMFVTVDGSDKQGNNKHYNLVLKCSKSSQVLLDSSPMMRLSYLNEMYVYDRIFPTFKQFQLDFGIEKPSPNVPKCYGMFHNESRYVVALENLKEAGYATWPQKHPLTRKHIDLVVEEYGKFHAVSVAMKEKEPVKFQELAGGCKDIIGMMLETGETFEKSIEYVYELIKDGVKSEISEKWLGFKERINSLLKNLNENNDGLKVIVHGDCWNNNFLYKNEGDNIQIAIIDWQLSKLSSPLTDLSYFLFSCISEEDIGNINTILKTYYDSFSGHLKCMDCSYITKYPFENLLEEWKKYCIYGAVICTMILKNAFTEKENLPDLGRNAEKGNDFAENFDFRVSDENGYAKRVLPVVKYIVNKFVCL